jgi:two-component system heavy metal sensor histidine kinase CusS
MSLALRLTGSIALIILCAFLSLGWLIERSLREHFAQQDAEELEVVAHSIQHVVRTAPAGVQPEGWQSRLAVAVQGHHGMFYHVRDAQGRTLFSMNGPALARQGLDRPAPSEVALDQLIEWDEGGQRYRGAVIRIDASHQGAQDFTAVVATVMSFHQHFLDTFRSTIWAASTLVAGLAIAATWLAVRRGHRPLREISARVEGITANHLHLRLDPHAVPIELADLTHSFNIMLERVEQDFKRLSDYAADIAHELRTPVTNLITQTQVLLTKERDPEAYREALYTSLDEFERMAKMIGDMLYLAQTDNQLIKPERVGVALHQEIQALFDYFEPWAEERQVRLHIDGPDCALTGDRLMLRRALSNLLTNAIRHTARGGQVTVQLERQADGVRVVVANPGPPIPPEHLPHLFDRFYRVDPSRQRNGDGAGLGLAIVKAIAEAHGGRVQARSEAGFNRFELFFPA